MFCKGGPGKNHQARLPGALLGLEGLSFILSRTEPWNTVYTHIRSNFSSWGVPMERFNSSLVPPNFRPRNTSSYTASIRGRIHTRFGSAESWSNILCPNILCVALLQHRIKLKSRIRIRIKVKSRIRIRIKRVWIRLARTMSIIIGRLLQTMKYKFRAKTT